MPLSVAALLFLVAYAWPILDVNLPVGLVRICQGTSVVVWLVFVVDYTVRVVLSRDRSRFVRTHLLDLGVVLIPVLRPLRLLALVRVVGALDRKAGGALRGRVAGYIVVATSLVIFIASLAVLEAERASPRSNIRTFADALWWSIETVTTVGYGDHYPVTAIGRVVAVGLMLAGIGLLGVVTASLATYLIERVSQVEAQSRAATQGDIEGLTAEVRALRKELDRARGPAGRPGQGGGPGQGRRGE